MKNSQNITNPQKECAKQTVETHGYDQIPIRRDLAYPRGPADFAQPTVPDPSS